MLPETSPIKLCGFFAHDHLGRTVMSQPWTMTDKDEASKPCIPKPSTWICWFRKVCNKYSMFPQKPRDVPIGKQTSPVQPNKPNQAQTPPGRSGSEAKDPPCVDSSPSNGGERRVAYPVTCVEWMLECDTLLEWMLDPAPQCVMCCTPCVAYMCKSYMCGMPYTCLHIGVLDHGLDVSYLP